MPTMMQALPKTIKRSQAARKGWETRKIKAFSGTTSMGSQGRIRKKLLDPAGARAWVKRELKKAVREGLPLRQISEGEAQNMMKSMIKFAYRVRAPGTLISRIRAADPQILNAIMRANDMTLEVFFSYDPNQETAQEVSIDNIRFIMDQYDAYVTRVMADAQR